MSSIEKVPANYINTAAAMAATSMLKSPPLTRLAAPVKASMLGAGPVEVEELALALAVPVPVPATPLELPSPVG